MNPTAFNLMRESECENVSNLEDQKMSVSWECVCVWFQTKSVGVLRGNSCGPVCTETNDNLTHMAEGFWESPLCIGDRSFFLNNLNINKYISYL